ncbi:MAG: zinc dependent phospholipase C family protein [Planctomycetes bacterium]|nr:zinc dependent phospholipase C family protein [Planctomycetota bacterium]
MGWETELMSSSPPCPKDMGHPAGIQPVTTEIQPVTPVIQPMKRRGYEPVSLVGVPLLLSSAQTARTALLENSGTRTLFPLKVLPTIGPGNVPRCGQCGRLGPGQIRVDRRSCEVPMKLGVWVIIIAGGVLLGDADTVLAWGPGTHIALSGSILERLQLLPTAIGALLARHGIAYLYGSIAADMVFAKRLSRVKQFCHHWSTGFKLLDSASDDSGTAFAYGYLSHLAADTIARTVASPAELRVGIITAFVGAPFFMLLLVKNRARAESL